MAFLVWVEFSVYGGQIKCRGRVLHTLIGRYKLRGKLWKVSSNKQLNCGNRVSIKSRELC
ncbi:hypothetical protein CTT30_06505 [Vibrio coralliilyticus]|nr:hypothetical protein CTT30_06505 [Vibrio coralliilyticus]